MRKNAIVLTRLRQLFRLSLPSAVLMQASLREICTLAKGASAALFRMDCDGHIVDCIADRLPDFTGESQQSLQGQERLTSRSPTALFIHNVLDANGCTSVLSANLSIGTTALGQVEIMKADGERLRSEEEKAILDVLPYLSGVLSTLARPCGTTQSDGWDVLIQQEILVCERDGTIVHSTDAGRTLLLLATGMPIGPNTLAQAIERGATLLRSLAQGRHRRDHHIISTAWGTFVLNALYLESAPTNPRSHFAVRLERYVPARTRLVELGRKASLSARQCDVALLMACGHSNTAIGTVLGMSPNTVKYHVRCLFDRLGIRCRADLLFALINFQRSEFAYDGLDSRRAGKGDS